MADTRTCGECGGSGEVPDYSAIGGAIRRGRLRREVSLRQAAKRLGMSRTHLSNIERGLANPHGRHGRNAIAEYVDEE